MAISQIGYSEFYDH